MRTILILFCTLALLLTACQASVKIESYDTVSIFEMSMEEAQDSLQAGHHYGFDGYVVQKDGVFYIANNVLTPIIEVRSYHDNFLQCLQFAELNVDQYGVAVLGRYQLGNSADEIVAIGVYGEARRMTCTPEGVSVDAS